MCVKLPLGDLNLSPCPPHPTSTYTCRVTIAPRVCDGRTDPVQVRSLRKLYLNDVKNIFGLH